MHFLIPTRNRPNSLRSVLGYLARFFPDQSVTIADGSFASYKTAVAQVIDEAGLAGAKLLSYPAEMDLIERYIDALDQIDSEFVVPCADDDYPLVGALEQAATLLVKRKPLAGVMLPSVQLKTTHQGLIDATLFPVPSYDQVNVKVRLKRYGMYHCVTSFGVFRKPFLQDRIAYFRAGYTTGFGDFETAVVDLLNGRLTAAPHLGLLRTENAHHSKLRSIGPAMSAQLGQVPTLLERLVQYAETRLADGQTDEARKIVGNAIARFIGYRAHREAVAEAAHRTLFCEDVLQAQLRTFDAVFRDGSAERAEILQQLTWAAGSLSDASLAEDNLGEAKIYDTISAMSAVSK